MWDGGQDTPVTINIEAYHYFKAQDDLSFPLAGTLLITVTLENQLIKAKLTIFLFGYYIYPFLDYTF